MMLLKQVNLNTILSEKININIENQIVILTLLLYKAPLMLTTLDIRSLLVFIDINTVYYSSGRSILTSNPATSGLECIESVP